MDSLHTALCRHPQIAPYLEATLERILPRPLPSCPLTTANLTKHNGAPLPPAASWRDDDAATFARAKYYLTTLPIEAWRKRVGFERTPSEVSLLSEGEAYAVEAINRRAPKSDMEGDDSNGDVNVGVAVEPRVPPSISPLSPPPGTPLLTLMQETHTRRRASSAPLRLPRAKSQDLAPVGSCSAHTHLALPTPHTPAPRITRLRQAYPPTPHSLDSGLGRSTTSQASNAHSTPPFLIGPHLLPRSPVAPPICHSPSLPIDAPDVLDIVYELQARAEMAEERARCFEVLLAQTATQLSRTVEDVDALKIKAAARTMESRVGRERRRDGDNNEDRDGRGKRASSLSPTYISPAPKRARSRVAGLAESFLARHAAPSRVSPDTERKGMENIARLFHSGAHQSGGASPLPRVTAPHEEGHERRHGQVGDGGDAIGH